MVSTSEQIEKIVLQNKNKKYLLFLNSPNNPSGQICNNLKEIAAIVDKYNFIVLSDEIYSELSFDDNYESFQIIVLKKQSDLSKWCGAADGDWIFMFPDNLKDICEKLKVLASETFSSVSSTDSICSYFCIQ